MDKKYFMKYLKDAFLQQECYSEISHLLFKGLKLYTCRVNGMDGQLSDDVLLEILVMSVKDRTTRVLLVKSILK